MFTSSSLTGIPVHSSRIVIDCSTIRHDTPGEGEMEVEKLLGWVNTYPRRSDIQVYLGSSGDRKLKHALQALGCKVTVRSQRTYTASQSVERMAMQSLHKSSWNKDFGIRD